MMAKARRDSGSADLDWDSQAGSVGRDRCDDPDQGRSSPQCRARPPLVT